MSGEEPFWIFNAIRRFVEHNNSPTSFARYLISLWQTHILGHSFSAEREGALGCFGQAISDTIMLLYSPPVVVEVYSPVCHLFLLCKL